MGMRLWRSRLAMAFAAVALFAGALTMGAEPSAGQANDEPPTVEIIRNRPDSGPGEVLTMTGRAMDDNDVERVEIVLYNPELLRWNGSEWVDGYHRHEAVLSEPDSPGDPHTWSYSLTVDDPGKYILGAYAFDSAGTISAAAWKAVYVTEAPETHINSAYSPEFGFTGTASDPDGTVDDVELVIYNDALDKTWDGDSFTARYTRVRADSVSPAGVGQTATWSYAFDPPGPGRVVVGAGAVDDVNRIDPSLDWQALHLNVIGGTILRSGSVTENGSEVTFVMPEAGVQVDLFEAESDGLRGEFIKQVRTRSDGSYSLGVLDGVPGIPACWVVVLIAPDGDTFESTGTKWVETTVCLGEDESNVGIDATLKKLEGWTQIFWDDFPTDVELGHFPGDVDDKWSAYPNTWVDTARDHRNKVESGERENHRGDKCLEAGGRYDPEAVVSIDDGIMKKMLHTADGEARVAAVVPRIIRDGVYDPYLAGPDKFAGQTYGRYAIRFKADTHLKGYKVAWLLWPDSGDWPGGGELDFPEGDLDRTIEGYVHWLGGKQPAGDYQWGAESGETFEKWHTAVMEWEPGRVAYYLDGELMREFEWSKGSANRNSEWSKSENESKIPNHEMHWVIQTETSLTDCNEPAADTAGYVYIDWVAAWSLDAE